MNYNFLTGDTEVDTQPLLLAASYTQVFGNERLIVQPFAFFYKRLDEDQDAQYGASIDIRYAKIQTLAHEVVDSFYVAGPDGPILDHLHQREIELALRHGLSLS